MTEKVNIPTFTLNTGRKVQAIGFGTWMGLSEQTTADNTDGFSYELDMSEVPRLVAALEYAIDVGYRNIDTAHAYRVEPEVGAAINKKIREGVVKREDLFVNTKVWQHNHRPADVEKSVRDSLRRLKLDYLDMVLMHWPMSVSQEGVDEKIDYVDAWRGFEAVFAKGLVKAIGVSNFNVQQLDRLLKNCKVPPASNQIEVNFNLANEELVKFCQANNVLVVGYSPLGTMIPSRAAKDTPEPKINNPVVVGIAKKHNKSVAQIVLRWMYERGMVSLPKTATKTRVIENASIFDFSLDKSDLEAIKKFDVGYRTVRPVFYESYQNYPFDITGAKEAIPDALLKWKNGANLDID